MDVINKQVIYILKYTCIDVYYDIVSNLYQIPILYSISIILYGAKIKCSKILIFVDIVALVTCFKSCSILKVVTLINLRIDGCLCNF